MFKFQTLVILIFLVSPPSYGQQSTSENTETVTSSITASSVYQKIEDLRRFHINGITRELELRNLSQDLSKTEKDKLIRAVMMSDSLNSIQISKMPIIMQLMKCINGRPIEAATITDICIKEGRLDNLIARAENLLKDENRILKELDEKVRQK
jgi:hypothetical protein